MKMEKQNILTEIKCEPHRETIPVIHQNMDRINYILYVCVYTVHLNSTSNNNKPHLL